MVAYFVCLVLATAGIGWWVGAQVESSIIQRTAAVTGLYIESFIGPHLQSLDTQDALRPADAAALRKLLADTELGRTVVSFKVWSPDGTVLFSDLPQLVGRQFPPDADLVETFAGAVTADVSDLGAQENEYERTRWSRLLQIYVPVRADGSGRIVAAAEFYQLPDALDADVASARLQSWAVVLLAAFASYLLVGFIVRRAGITIAGQDRRLREQVTELSSLLAEVENLNASLHVAAGQTIEVATEERRRIGADIHDGPIQAMALARLRLEAFQDSSATPGHDDSRLAAAHGAIGDALAELRQIAAGLRLPDLARQTPAEAISRACDDHARRSGTVIQNDVGNLPADAPLPVKIALFRGLQEALSNATRHGGGIGVAVRSWAADGFINTEVRDRGPGFVISPERSDSGLGLTGIRERAAILGGTATITSRPGRGTTVHISLPLDVPETAGEAIQGAIAHTPDRTIARTGGIA